MDRSNSIESLDDSDPEESYNPFPTSFENPGQMLDTWLAELDNLTSDCEKRPAVSFGLNELKLDEAEDDDLNAILGELAALQLSLDKDLQNQSKISHPVPESIKPMETTIIPSHTNHGARTESPDNDSGFSDNVSLLSSGSSLSGSGSNRSITAKTKARHVTSIQINQHDDKAEKIRAAIGKIRAGNGKVLCIKAYCMDGSWKAVMVDDGMSCGRVLSILADKNHVPLNRKSCLVEHIPNLHIQRVYEDHERMVHNLSMWSHDSKNKIFFVERDDKYDIFKTPEAQGSSVTEFFSQGLGIGTNLYLKAEGKKTWKKFPFVLRPSGVYYSPKGKIKSSKDLVQLCPIDANIQVYEGLGWRKKFKSPTEFGFLLKPPQLQVKSPRHMKYLCAEDCQMLKLWITGFRIAKHGKTLWGNYRNLEEVITQLEFPIPIPIQPQVSKTGEHSKVNSLNSDVGFEIESPNGGTIKRKMPKIPLTLTTRHIVSDLMKPTSQSSSRQASIDFRKPSILEEDQPLEFANLPPPPPELLNSANFDEVTVVSEPFCGSETTTSKLKDPPQEFLCDLTKVLEKKSEVSKKCAIENTTPSEVIGLGGIDNVQAWVSQHYGNSMKKQAPPPPPKPPKTSLIYENFQENHQSIPEFQQLTLRNQSNKQKPPPPPPPKRSNSTTLSQQFL